MDCYICGKEYKSWQGLFYHKRKVHHCEDVRSSRYEYELKHAAKIAEGKVRKCIFCPRRLHKITMEKHYLEKHKENFTWMKCKLCCREHREEMLKNHIKEHNIYFRDEYYMKPEKLEDLLNTEHYDVILVTLKNLQRNVENLIVNLMKGAYRDR